MQNKCFDLFMKKYELVVYVDHFTNEYQIFKNTFVKDSNLPTIGKLEFFIETIKRNTYVTNIKEIIELISDYKDNELNVIYEKANGIIKYSLIKQIEDETKGIILIKDITSETKQETMLFNMIKEERKIIEETCIAKNNFLLNASREIRTPLNAIMGLIEVMRHEIQDNRTNKYLNELQIVTNKLDKIVNDSFIDTKNYNSDCYEDFNVNETINEIINKYQDLKINYISFSKIINRHIYSDKKRLKEIVNTIIEVLKATRIDDIVITSEEKHTSYNQISYLTLTIGPKNINDVIKYIYNLEQEITKLKLFNMILSMNAILTIDNELIYIIEVPLIIEENCIEEKVNCDKPLDLANKHLLIVEDNQMNIEIISNYISWTKATYDIAKDGVEAVKKYQEKPYDMILMDIQMPNMNGYEATKNIRLLEKDHQTPIVAMTADGYFEGLNKAKKVGMNDYITKPINLEVLNEVLYKYLFS